MRYVIAYAGIPQDFYDRVYAARETFIGNAQYFGRPLSEGAVAYNENYTKIFLNHFEQLIARDHDNSLSDTAFAVVAVNHDKDSTDLLRKALFPSIYCATVSWAPVWGSKMEINNSANSLIEMLRNATRKTKAALSLLGDEVVARSNSTPLLLPLKNFNSKTLEEQIQLLHRDFHNAEDYGIFIREAIDRIRHAHPPERVGESSKRAFTDDSNIIYASPGRDRHAFARPSSNHPISCVLSGKRRLGAPYDHAFHYDCTRVGQARLKGKFFGCHQVASEYTGAPHLNIAPNDFIR